MDPRGPSRRTFLLALLLGAPLIAHSLSPQRPFGSSPREAISPASSRLSQSRQPRQPAKRVTVVIDGKSARTTEVPANQQRTSDYYWKEAKIHNFGNTGLLGRLHAFVAPLATFIIDKTSYAGRNVRKEVHKQVEGVGTVLDLCCGVGISTAPNAIGVDASEEMIDAARFYNPGTTFRVGNAETFGEPFSYDVVTIMFAMHEMPKAARLAVLRNAARIARKYVLVVDIDPKYKLMFLNDPVKKAQADAFLSGEPYVLDYLKQVHRDIQDVASERGWAFESKALLEGHVMSWRIGRNLDRNDVLDFASIEEFGI